MLEEGELFDWHTKRLDYLDGILEEILGEDNLTIVKFPIDSGEQSEIE